ncbi:MAG: SemiSWEET family sugar transporter [Hyphomonas sp.]|nr:SemiSWEET family sugar transporter [Hyphomonas sp.]
MNSDLLGSAAAVLTTASFLPQALQVIRTRDTAAISLAMYSMFVTGVALWLAYGLLIGELPVILANAVTLGLASIILTRKVQDTLARRRPQG